LDTGLCDVIGDRAFHSEPEAVAELGDAFITGMSHAGMPCVAKHFPGHGNVEEDTHTEEAIDERDEEEIFEEDLFPFAELISEGQINAIMPSHVIYPDVDEMPAGFSSVWLQDILRDELEFEGAVFSDDLSMSGASIIPDITTRAQTAFDAGCDMVLVCNDRKGALEVLNSIEFDEEDDERLGRLIGMHGVEVLEENEL